MMVMRPEEILTREDLVRFIELLVDDLIHHSDEWENAELLAYLESLSGWIADMNGAFRNRYGTDAPETPSWSLIGKMLLAAKYYE